MFEIDMAMELIEEAASTDLEGCQAAIRAGDAAAGLAHSEQALAKLSMALDALRDIPRQPHDLGLSSKVF